MSPCSATMIPTTPCTLWDIIFFALASPLICSIYCWTQARHSLLYVQRGYVGRSPSSKSTHIALLSTTLWPLESTLWPSLLVVIGTIARLRRRGDQVCLTKIHVRCLLPCPASSMVFWPLYCALQTFIQRMYKWLYDGRSRFMYCGYQIYANLNGLQPLPC